MEHDLNYIQATWEDIDKYLIKQEMNFSYHDRAIGEKLASILWLHYPWDRRFNDRQGKLIAWSSTYNITNYVWLAKDSKYVNDENLLKILHAEMGNNPQLMELIHGDLQLTNGWISRINNVFNEMESHYLLYKPKLQYVIAHFLGKNIIGDCIVTKNITIKWKSQVYRWLKLNNDKKKATSEILDYMKALLILEDNIPTSCKRNNILWHYLHFFERRLHMDLSEIYQKRTGLFSLIAKNILSYDDRIIYDKESFLIKEISNDTEYQDTQYSISVNFIMYVHWLKIKCTLHGRTKSAKSINDKLESNPNYDYLDAMDDLFWYTITTEAEDDLWLVSGVFMSQLLSKRVGSIENNIDWLKLSSKWWLFDENMKQKVQDIIDDKWKIFMLDQKIQSSVKIIKQITSDLYKDFKVQASFTNIDGHACGCEIKYMTIVQFENSEKSEEAGNNVMKIKNKISKDNRYEKILSTDFVSKFISKLETTQEFRGEKINKNKVKSYIKQALYCVKFTYEWKVYIGYIAKDYLQYFKEQKLISDDVQVINWIDPVTLIK